MRTAEEVDLPPNQGTNLPDGGDLRALVARIEKLEDDRAAVGSDIREVYAEAKAAGFNTKVLRLAIRRRRMDAVERRIMDEELDLYEAQLEADLEADREAAHRKGATQ